MATQRGEVIDGHRMLVEAELVGWGWDGWSERGLWSSRFEIQMGGLTVM